MLRLSILSGMAILVATAAQAQTPLSAYADKDGYVLVKKLTCAQLAGTFQEDADFLGVWYSGWYNGLGNKSAFNIQRVKDGIHQTIVYCQANPNKTVIQAIRVVLDREKAAK